MNPRKSKDLIEEVADDLSVSQNLVEAVTKLYWKEVWQNLTSLSSPKVHIENLGDFNIKHWLLEKEILKCTNLKLKNKDLIKSKYVSGITIEERMSMISNIKLQVEEEKQRKDFIYEHKKIIKEFDSDIQE